jgi:hypothetical protein
MLAGAVDVALAGGLAWLLRRRAPGVPDARGVASASRWIPVLGPSSELVREQLGSPGQRMLGIRTVDRRTGARVALWRTLIMTAAAVTGNVLARRNIRGAAPEPERSTRELGVIEERHAGDPQARDAAIRDLITERRENADFGRRVSPVIAVGMLTSFLLRRLRPTTEVSVRTRD